MEQSITFRPEVDADEPFLSRLYATTRDYEMDQVLWDKGQKAAFLQSQFTLQRLHYRKYYPNAAFLIIQRVGEPIGRFYVERSGRDIVLLDIALLPEFRGKDLGSQVMGELLAEAKSTGKVVRIHVERNNPALRLYQRMKFRLVEDKGIHFLMEWSADEGKASA
jgi:ribosomal protein S18 acetylase RimI-like enzyme